MAGVIVGTRMLGWKRSRRMWIAGAWRLACWFEVEHHELHSTKGWRRVKRFKRPVAEQSPEWRKAPPYQEYFVPARPKPTRDLVQMEFRLPEKSLLKHDWYRRQKFGSSKRLREASDAEMR